MQRKVRHMRYTASEKRKSGLKKRFCTSSEPDTSRIVTHLSAAAFFLPEPAHTAVSFPKIKPHAPNTKQTPAREDLSFFERVGQSMWALGDRLKQNDMRYAIKTGMALAMLAAPAFFDATRPIFVEYKGEWALISVGGVLGKVVEMLRVHLVLCSHLANDRSSKPSRNSAVHLR